MAVQKLSILIPCYNERATLRPLVEKVLAVQLPSFEMEVVVVDDASTDGSADVAPDTDTDESADLASERGAYPNFAGSGWSRGLVPIDTLEAMERRIQRPLRHLQERARRLIDSLRNRVAMQLLERQRLEDQQVEGALESIVRMLGGHI